MPTLKAITYPNNQPPPMYRYTPGNQFRRWLYHRMLDAPRHSVLVVPPERHEWAANWMKHRRPDLKVRKDKS